MPIAAERAEAAAAGVEAAVGEGVEAAEAAAVDEEVAVIAAQGLVGREVDEAAVVTRMRRKVAQSGNAK